MTKTLAQVSAIAATNIHILDDDDLGERLKMLEWLLLADIPEREIRPDTRAAFAAGQIASLAPVLIQEADGLVDTARRLARLRSRKPDPERSTAEERECYQQELDKLTQELKGCEEEHEKAETILLARCFNLLLQSLREYPGKARLFYRIHQYCRVTGYAGLQGVANWLKETRTTGRGVWADYYAGLSLQIMAQGILTAARQIEADDALRSDLKAAFLHLDDVSKIDVAAFITPREREAWFHAVGRREFGVSLLMVAQILADWADASPLSMRLMALARLCINVPPGASAVAWEAETGRTSGAWAHHAENSLGRDAKPSAAWVKFSPHFAFEHRIDSLAARRYPERLPEAGWSQLLGATETLPENDSGWLRDVIGADEARRVAAHASGKIALTRAARSLDIPSKNWMTLAEWTEHVASCSPFDPRRSEWTALEITRQLVKPAVSFDGDEAATLDRLHPNNVLLPRAWISKFGCHKDWTEVSWEEWRHFAQSAENDQARLRDAATTLLDYRYSTDSKAGLQLDEWERRLIAVGRLLLGLLRNDYSAPRLWNIRGNEQIVRLPRTRWFEALAISSPTLLLVESCLGARTAETRSILRAPDLFGWGDGTDVNDSRLDPPLLFGATPLLEAIIGAQKVLQANQLAVAMNQPRQLIPFWLSGFVAGTEAEHGENDDVE